MKRVFLVGWMAATVVALGQPPAERPPMSPERKAELVQRADEAWANLPAEAKIRLWRLHQALTQMPPEDRRFIHDRIERFLQMPPEEREQTRKNAQRWKEMSPEERERAREKFRQRRQEFEQKWRAEHPGEEPPPFPPRGRPQDGAAPKSVNPQPTEGEKE